LTMLFDVSYNSYVPAIVRRDLLVQANSRLQTSSAVAQVAGPGLGGGLVQLVTAPVALLADAVSFLVSAICLLRIRDREPAPPPRPADSSMLREIRAGLVIVGRQPLLRGLVGIAAFFNFFSQWISTLLVLFAVRELGMRAGNIGLIGTGAALGAVAGSLVTTRLSRRIGVGRTMIAAVAIESGVMLGVAAAPSGHPGRATALLTAIYAASGVGAASSSILATSIRQTLTPAEFIGRMTATYKMISYGVVSLGALCGGVIGQLLGLRPGILLGAVGLLLTIVWTVLSAVSRLGELPTEPLRMDAAGRVVVPVEVAAAAATPAAQVQAGVQASTGGRPGGVPDADPSGPPD
jgi:predicted MFS family arabinose efflux permease